MAPVRHNITRIYLEQTSTYFGSNTNTPAVITDGVVPAPKKLRKWLWVLLAVLCVAVCVFIGWYLGQHDGQDGSTPTATPASTAAPTATMRANIINLKATDFSRSLGYVSLNWDVTERSDATYEIYRREDTASDYSLLATTSNTWYDDRSYTAGTRCVYRVVAYVEGSEHAWAETSVAIAASPTPIPVITPAPTATPTPSPSPTPAPLQTLRATVYPSNIYLTWGNHSADSDKASYKLFRREAHTSDWKLVTETILSTYRDHNVVSGTAYVYMLEITVGDKVLVSTEVSATMPKPTPTPSPSPTPAPLQTLRATAYPSNIYLTWGNHNTNSARASYKLFRREAHTSDWKLVTETILSTYRDHNVVPGTAYVYMLKITVGDKVLVSTEVSATMPKPTPTPSPSPTPTPLQTLRATAYPSNIFLVWDNHDTDSAKASYSLFRREVNASDWSCVAFSTLHSWRDNHVIPGTTYVYRLEISVGGKVFTSTEVSATVPMPTPTPRLTPTPTPAPKPTPTVRGQISALMAVPSFTNIRLSWGNTNVTVKNTEYRLYRQQTDSKNARWTRIATTTMYEYTDFNVVPGTKYAYKVEYVVDGDVIDSAVVVAIIPQVTPTPVPADLFFSLDMPIDEYHSKFLSFIEDAQTWDQNTAPRKLHMLPFLPDPFIQLYHDVLASSPSLTAKGKTFTWNPDFPAPLINYQPETSNSATYQYQFSEHEWHSGAIMNYEDGVFTFMLPEDVRVNAFDSLFHFWIINSDYFHSFALSYDVANTQLKSLNYFSVSSFYDQFCIDWQFENNKLIIRGYLEEYALSIYDLFELVYNLDTGNLISARKQQYFP